MLPENTTAGLLADLRQLIHQSQRRAVAAVNAELTLLYWTVGKRLQLETLKGDRAEYGKQVVAQVAQQLALDFGKGWSARQLWMCIQLVAVFPDREIVHTLCAELSWSHLRLLVSLEQPLQREFYIEMCRLERWSVRQLQECIQSMLFERIAISRKPEDTIQRDIAALRRTAPLHRISPAAAGGAGVGGRGMSAVQFRLSEGKVVFATELIAACAYSAGARGRFGLDLSVQFPTRGVLGSGV